MSSLTFFLTGCWDNGEVQEINYLSAFGIDFHDGEYYIYAQMLDYEGISGPEGVPSSQPPIWVGKGRRKTLAEATKKLYTTSQQKLSWSQVTALVLSESMLTHERIRDVIDKSNRTEDISYRKWIYGTKENIEELFTSTPFVGIVRLVSPHSVIGFESTNDGVKYRLKIKVTGKVVNLYKEGPFDEFKKMTKDVFKKELIGTFRKTTPKHGPLSTIT